MRFRLREKLAEGGRGYLVHAKTSQVERIGFPLPPLEKGFALDCPGKITLGENQIGLVSLDGVEVGKKRILPAGGIPNSPSLLFPVNPRRVFDKLHRIAQWKIRRRD